MIRADDKFSYEDEEGQQKVLEVTNFEILKSEVDQLKNIINQHAEILRQNNLTLKVEANSFNDLEN